MKQITVFGANGRIGTLVVNRLLTKKYKVVAFVHRSHNFEPHENLRIIQGNIYDSASVKDAIKGSKAVISTLGSWGTPKKDILSTGMKHIIPAMETNKVKRIITVTGSDAFEPMDKPNTYLKLRHKLFSMLASSIMRDAEEHMRLLRSSRLDWTVVRSPVMTDRGADDGYVLRNKFPKFIATVSRNAVADAIIWLLETGEYVRRAPIIYRK